MRVFITGATGLIGGGLVRALEAKNRQPVVLTRNPTKAEKALGRGVEVVEGNPKEAGKWMDALSGCDGAVNLAGEPVAGRRWTEAVKKEIVESRVQGTRNLAEAIRRADPKPKVFVSASAVGFYGPLPWEKTVDEASPAGNDFLAEACRKWEAAADLGDGGEGVRKAIVRIGVVLDPAGGALKKMLPPFKMMVGGPIGDGSHPFPWIHLEDIVGVILHALENDGVEGVLNGVSPKPVTNKEFSKALGRALGRPAVLPTPPFAFKLAFGEGATILTTGQRVEPNRTVESGYVFVHPDLDEALEDLLK